MAVYRPTYTDQKTGKRKQSQTWRYRFYFRGSKYEGSTGFTKKTLARQVAKQKKDEAIKVAAGIPVEAPSERTGTVAERLNAYIRRYQLTHRERPKSVAWVTERTAHIQRVLGRLRIHEVTEDRIEAYMLQRLTEGAGNRTVNMEVENLSRALNGTWRVLWPGIKKLEEPRDVGRRLTDEEQERILQAAARNKSPYIYLYVMIQCNAPMRSQEARRLRWADVDFDKQEFVIRRAKTTAGAGRPIPMNTALYAAFATYASWYASRFGGLRSEWFVFPFSSRVMPTDPTRPVTTLKSAWGTVRDEAGVKCRLHDLRHTTTTRMLEHGIPPDTVRKLAGWISQKMIDRYYHPSAEARRQAVAALDSVTIVKEYVKGDENGTGSKTIN